MSDKYNAVALDWRNAIIGAQCGKKNCAIFHEHVQISGSNADRKAVEIAAALNAAASEDVAS